MFRALLGIGQQFGLEGHVLGRRGAPGTGAGDRADGDLAVAQSHEDFRGRADQLEARKVQIVQERRGVGAAQGPVEGERLELERGREPVAGHHLEDVAGGDVRLGSLDDLAVGLRADRRGPRIGSRRGRRAFGGRVERARQVGRHGQQAGLRRRVRLIRRRRRGSDGGDQDDFLGDGVEDGDDRGADHHGVRQSQRVGVDIRQPLDQPHHVIAQRPEQPRRHRRQSGRQVQTVGRHQVAQ